MSGTEVTEFANYVGANPLRPDYTRGEQRPLRSKSYFVLEELNFVIKISRIGNNGKEPFWGLGYCQLDILRKRGNCHAVLLDSSETGWTFSQVEIDYRIESGLWRTGADGQQYKIVGPLSENNRFNSPAEFLKMIGKD